MKAAIAAKRRKKKYVAPGGANTQTTLTSVTSDLKT
jgi:hypothetical protein